jgi:hypothetical protein
MATLVECPLEHGGSFVVEVEHGLRLGPARAGPARGLGAHDVAGRAGTAFEAVVERVQPAAVAIVDSPRSLVDPPGEIDAELGIRLRAEIGAIVARAGDEANFRIALRGPRVREA